MVVNRYLRPQINKWRQVIKKIILLTTKTKYNVDKIPEKWTIVNDNNSINEDKLVLFILLTTKTKYNMNKKPEK